MRFAPTPSYSATLMGAPDGASRNLHTLYLMRQLVERDKCDPRILQAAHSIIFTTLEKDQLGEVTSLFEYVRDHIRYTMDVHGVETLCAPVMTLQRMLGDCDDKTMLLCALFEACGYPTRFVMAEYESGDWEHVYCQVCVRGHWLDCDPIERGAHVGWAPPDPRRIYIERV